MTYHSLIILASILLNLFYSINGRSIQCPSEWITNGDEGKTLLKTNTSRTAEAGGAGGHMPPDFSILEVPDFQSLHHPVPVPVNVGKAGYFL